jgi:hypothetical protein
MIVPRRGTGYIPTEPRPIVRPPLAAFTPPQPIDVSPAIHALTRIIDEEQQKVDQTVILGADAKLASLSNQLLYDPQTGALLSRGQDAVKANRDALDTWQRESSAIETSLSENQRVAFQRVLANRSDDLGRVLAQHSAREVQQTKIDAAQANVDAERTATLQNYATTGDLSRVQLGIEHQRTALTLAGSLVGAPQEVTNRVIAQEISRIHTGVLSEMIAKDQDLAASKYFQAHLNELEPETLLELQKHIDVASLRGESQRRSDSILTSTATLGGALAEAAKIEDPQLRDATEDRLHKTYQLRKADEVYQRDEAYQRAGQVLERTHDIDKIAPADWLKLNVTDREALKNREYQIRYPRKDSNPDLYFSLMNMAGLNDATRKEFDALNLGEYREQLSPAHFDQLVRLQRTARVRADAAAKKDSAAAAKAGRAQSILNSLMKGSGNEGSPTVPGGPLDSAPRGDGKTNLGAPVTSANKSLPPLPPEWVERARRSKVVADFYRNLGYRIP